MKWTFFVLALGTLSRWPGAFFLVAIWSTLRCFGVDFSWNSGMGMTLVVFSFIVLVAEFGRSGTVSPLLIGIDLFFAIAALMLAEWTIIHMADSRIHTDWLILALVVWDAWFSTMNSIRVTYRRVQVR